MISVAGPGKDYVQADLMPAETVSEVGQGRAVCAFRNPAKQAPQSEHADCANARLVRLWKNRLRCAWVGGVEADHDQVPAIVIERRPKHLVLR
ncbi:MAG TPA: hypothetical protein VJV39_04995, partial [Dongiaceae bacterium]|nr:hypothetical protein [Dongiaceae bacterium]